MKKTLSELEKELTINLSKLPNLKELLEESLLNDLRQGGLEKNGILQTFLDPNDFLEIQEKTLERITQQDNDAIIHWRKKLKGANEEKIANTWVEVLAYDSLINNAFVDIEVVPDTASRFPGSKPDLLAKKDGRSYLIEVTHLSPFPDPIDYVFQRIKALYIQEPTRFGKSFDVSMHNLGNLIKLDQPLIAVIDALIKDIRENIDTIDLFRKKWSQQGKEYELIVEIKDGHFSLFGGGDTMQERDSQRVENLTHLSAKLLLRAGEKIMQLQAVDPQYEFQHFVLIRMDESPAQSVFWSKDIEQIISATLKNPVAILDPKCIVEVF